MAVIKLEDLHEVNYIGDLTATDVELVRGGIAFVVGVALFAAGITIGRAIADIEKKYF